MAEKVSAPSGEKKGNWAIEGFKTIKDVELKGGLLFSAVAAFVAPTLVAAGLIFSAWEFGQLKVVEAYENRKNNIPKSGVVYQAT